MTIEFDKYATDYIKLERLADTAFVVHYCSHCDGAAWVCRPLSDAQVLALHKLTAERA